MSQSEVQSPVSSAVAPGSGTYRRDERMDTVRGMLLVMMAINHIDSDARIITDQPFGFVSSAEGFIFLSGLVAGQAYTRRFYSGGMRNVWRACGRRAFEIYLWAAATALATLLWCQLLVAFGRTDLPRLPELFVTRPLEGLWAGLAMLYQPGLLDILPNYVGFVLLAPLIVYWCEQGAFWRVWVGSGAVWLADQLLAPPHPIILGPINTGAFHFLSWQWLFVTGLLLGNVRFKENRLMRHPRTITVVVAVIAAIFLWVVHHPALPNWWNEAQLATLTNKTSLGPIRVINFSIVAFLVGVAASKRPTWFHISFFSYLGRHSLPAFGANVIATMIVLTWPSTFDTSLGRWLDSIAVLAALVVGAIASEQVQKHRRARGAAADPRPQSTVAG